MKKLKQAVGYPLTLVHSGAGYGKSSALSLYVHDVRKNFCWYTISSNDDDIIPFVSYIVFSLRKRYPFFGAELMEYMETMDKYIRDEEIYTLCALFINEISRIQEETILVLDDFHLVDHSFTINQWLERVIEHLPGIFHIVISTRNKPKWSLLTKWKVSGRILEISEKDLTLDFEEVKLLFQEFYGVIIEPHQLESVFRLTEGWAIALSMIAEQLDKGTSILAILNYHHSSMEELFHYLAIEVFSKQSPIIQSFLEQTSIFEDITPQACDEILGIQGSELMLEQLAERNAFLHKIWGSKQYRFHALFRASLQKKLKEEQEELFRQLHERCARYYENTHHWEQAVHHYEQIQAYGAIANLLEKNAYIMLQSGRLEGLHDKLKKVPKELKNRYRILWFYEGEVLRYQSYYERAERCYKQLIHQTDKKDPLIGKAYEGIARIYLDTIQPGKAERFLYLAIEATENQSFATESEKQVLYLLMAENLVNSGQAVKAERWYEKGKMQNVHLNDGNLDARLFLRTGKLEMAKRTLLQRLSTEINTLPQSHRETDILLSFIEACMGNGEQAKELAQKGIERGVRYKSSFVEACGWMRMGHAVQLLDHYDNKLAEECYMTALNMMEEMKISRGKAEPYMGLCILYGRTGDFEKAKEFGKMALEETEKVYDLWLSSLIQLCMGITYFLNNELGDALTILEEAKGNFQQCGDSYGLMMCDLWNSFLFYEINDDEQFMIAISSFLKEIQLGSYEFIFQRKTPFSPKDLQSIMPLLIKAKELEVHSAFTYRILKEMGYEELDSHPGYTLKVETLGEFRVWLGERIIEERDWHRGKAKELFQFFLSHRQKWWGKEEIYQILWPDAEEKSMDQEFKVLINSLNRTLEPNRKARATPFFIQRQNNAYSLNRKAVMDVDSIQFEEWVITGMEEKNPVKARNILKKGLELYKGDFLPERNDVWSVGERERLLTIFLRGAEKLAQLYVQMNLPNEAIVWCEKIVKIDSAWEEAYRLIMYCYYQKNNRPQAIKWYKKCELALKKELGVEPMEPTKNMYEMILSGAEIRSF
ncbi:BTAD domain-containing putative transcriptional regulator [Bacillus sp. FJAT-49736]|uniref:BTAD domain-containing putative transcriptional regulator n=1 Tax=Bacillus sp. FJAT-49736 TaxID=2833582 RepID=UPI0020161343|nr:BTAD domain-containing putative transcriptional regulator [Bacillus sp. FJAT-49736]